MHALRYVCKSTAGNPLQVWLHVCAWWITSWRVCRRVLNDLDFLDRVIGAGCVNGCCSLRNAWVLTSHFLSSCLPLNVASKSDRRRRRNHVCVGTMTSTGIWICHHDFPFRKQDTPEFQFWCTCTRVWTLCCFNHFNYYEYRLSLLVCANARFVCCAGTSFDYDLNLGLERSC